MEKILETYKSDAQQCVLVDLGNGSKSGLSFFFP